MGVNDQNLVLNILTRLQKDGQLEIRTGVVADFINEKELERLRRRIKKCILKYAKCKKLGKGVYWKLGDRIFNLKSK